MARKSNAEVKVEEPVIGETVQETVQEQPTKTVEKEVTKDQQKTLDALTTISAKIRYLDKESFTRSQIAKIVDRRYQHVRNVLETPLKRKVAEGRENAEA